MGQKPKKNQIFYNLPSTNSGNIKKTEKMALKSALDIVNKIDYISPKFSDKIENMIKKAIKYRDSRAILESVEDALSETGIPHDLQFQLGLLPQTPEAPRPSSVLVHILDPESYEKNIGENQKGMAFYSRKIHPIRSNNLYFTTPAIFLKGYDPTTLVHEVTHLYDEDLQKKIARIKNDVEYQLNKNELLADFNAIISAIYFNNNLTYPVFFSQHMQKVTDLQFLKSNYFSNIILWSLIKESIEKNGFYETIKMKEQIIKEAEKYFCDHIANLFADVYFKNSSGLKFKDAIKSLNFIIRQIIFSFNISLENKERIIKSFLRLAKNPSRDWMSKKIKDEVYNFYGERFLKDIEKRKKQNDYENNYAGD